MKKIFIGAILLSAVSFNLHAQKLTEAKVPAAVKAGFTKAHPGAVASWEWEAKNYEANFKEGGKDVSVVINKAGMILETETEIVMSELPAPAQTYIRQHYKDAKITEVAKIVKHDGSASYETRLNGKEVMFDANGNYKKAEKEKED